MDQLNDTKVIKFYPDTLEIVRKDVNLNEPGRVVEAVDILENWVKNQAHFNKKDFCREYLERSLVTGKGLVERTKERLDKLCTFKTLMPEFFAISDAKKEFSSLPRLMPTANLPKLTSEHYRVFITKVPSEESLNPNAMFTFYKYLTMVCEYFKRYEYCAGFILILDYSEVNILNMVTKLNPSELRQVITLLREGYGMRIKGIHVITPSKMVESLIALLKQVFSEKLAGRFHTHKSKDTISEFVAKDILPADYGGEEKTLSELHGAWIDELTSKEFLDYFSDMTKANTNESYREKDDFNKSYMGMPGTFRTLSVD